MGAIHVGAGEAALRESLVLLAVPVMAAVRTIIVVTMFRRLIGAIYPAVLLGLIDIAAASSVTVCSVPESYAFTVALLATAFWLALDDEWRTPAIVIASWVIVAALAIGVTASNAVPIALLASASLMRRGRGFFASLPLVVALVGVAFTLAGAVVIVGAWTFHYRLGVPDRVFAPQFVHPPSVRVAAGVLWAIGHTFLAPVPGTEPQMIAAPHVRYDFMFSYAPPFRHTWPSVWRALATVAVVALGTARLAHRRSLRPVIVAVAGILGFNLLIHLYYGLHFNLYAGHWEPALLVLVAGTALPSSRSANAGSSALLAFSILTVASSVALIHHAFDYIVAH